MFGLGKKKRGIKFNVVRDEDTVYIEFSEGVVDTSASEYMTSVISLPIALDMVDAVSLALLKRDSSVVRESHPGIRQACYNGRSTVK